MKEKIINGYYSFIDLYWKRKREKRKEFERLKKENQELKMKLGLYRNAVRQDVSIKEMILEEVPEEWEPNVSYN